MLCPHVHLCVLYVVCRLALIVPRSACAQPPPYSGMCLYKYMGDLDDLSTLEEELIELYVFLLLLQLFLPYFIHSTLSLGLLNSIEVS